MTEVRLEHRRRWRSVALLVGTLAAVCAFWLVSQHSAAHATSPTPNEAYPALNSTAPTGLPLLSVAAKPWRAGDSTEPAYPAEVPAGQPNAPIPSSIRRVSVPLSTVSVWIAKSTEGGVCVLASPHKTVDGPPALAVGCSEAANREEGATDEVTSDAEPGRVVMAGVVPSGVSQVTRTLASGAVVKIAVSDNAWAYETNTATASAARRHP